MRLVDSLNCSTSEIEPAEAGESSKAGVNAAVMPARAKVTDWTDDAGA